MQRRKLHVLVVVTVLNAVFAPLVVAAPPKVAVSVEPARLEARSGETFTVRVMVEGAQDLSGFQFKLTYDPSVVEVEDAEVAGFLSSTGRVPIPLGPKVDNDGGAIVIGAATFGESSGPGGSGVLATVTFTAREEGSSALALEDVQVLDSAAANQAIELTGGHVVVRSEEGTESEDAALDASTRLPSADPSAAASPRPATGGTEGSLPSSRGAVRPSEWGWGVKGLLTVLVIGIVVAALGLLTGRGGSGE